MDAALPLKTTFSSLTCVFTDDKDMLTDPNTEEEENSVSMLTYIVDRQGSLISSHSKGTFTTEQVDLHVHVHVVHVLYQDYIELDF